MPQLQYGKPVRPSPQALCRLLAPANWTGVSSHGISALTSVKVGGSFNSKTPSHRHDFTRVLPLPTNVNATVPRRRVHSETAVRFSRRQWRSLQKCLLPPARRRRSTWHGTACRRPWVPRVPSERPASRMLLATLGAGTATYQATGPDRRFDRSLSGSVHGSVIADSAPFTSRCRRHISP